MLPLRMVGDKAATFWSGRQLTKNLKPPRTKEKKGIAVLDEKTVFCERVEKSQSPSTTRFPSCFLHSTCKAGDRLLLMRPAGSDLQSHSAADQIA